MENETSSRDEAVPYNPFYFDFVIFQVENSLYKLPRQSFEKESDLFRDMFRLPPPASGADGQSDDRPVELQGIDKEDWHRLLRLMFPQAGDAEFNLNDWTSVLKLSTLWEMTRVRAKAVEAMSKLPIKPVYRMVLARKYDVRDWLSPSLHELIARNEPLSADEARSLGLECAMNIAAIRECIVCLGGSRWDLKNSRGEMIIDKENLRKAYALNKRIDEQFTDRTYYTQ